MEEDNKLQTFTLQMQLPAPNLEVAKRVADEAQRLIDIYGYYNFLNLVEFMKQNPSMVQMGLSLINKKIMQYGRNEIQILTKRRFSFYSRKR
jgi:hypothetical protein